MKSTYIQENLLPVIQKNYDQFHRWVGQKYRLPVYWMNFQNKVFVKDTDLKIPIYCYDVFYGYLVIKKGKLLPQANQYHLRQLHSLIFNSMEEETLWNEMKLNTEKEQKQEETLPSKIFFVVSKDKKQRKQFALSLHQSLKTLFMLSVKNFKESISHRNLPFTVLFLEEVNNLSREEIQQLPIYLKQFQERGTPLVIGSKHSLSYLCKKYKMLEQDLKPLYKNMVEL